VEVHQIYTSSFLRNFSYVLESPESKFAYCIDPWDADQIIEILNKKSLKLKAIINTHEHGDHTRGNESLVKKTGCQVWAHKNAKGKISGIDTFLNGGEKISLERGWYLRVLDTPGHTFAHLCLLLEGPDGPTGLFSGDTLFNAGVGNCHNGGDPEVLFETVSEQLKDLPGDVLLYPGHEYLENNLGFTLDREPSNAKARDLFNEVQKINPLPSGYRIFNMDLERKINTFFRLENEEIRKGLPGVVDSDKQVFLRLRELRNKW